MSTAISGTMRGGVAGRAKKPGEILRLSDEIRQSAGELMDTVFPAHLKRFAIPRLPESTITKARRGYVCNPFFRAGLCVLAIVKAGGTREQAQRLADWMQELVDVFFPVSTDDAELEAMIRCEQGIDAAEDIEETDFLLRVPGADVRWLRKLQERFALDRSLIRALSARTSRRQVA
jgi:hypothetical protein